MKLRSFHFANFLRHSWFRKWNHSFEMNIFFFSLWRENKQKTVHQLMLHLVYCISKYPTKGEKKQTIWVIHWNFFLFVLLFVCSIFRKDGNTHFVRVKLYALKKFRAKNKKAKQKEQTEIEILVWNSLVFNQFDYRVVSISFWDQNKQKRNKSLANQTMWEKKPKQKKNRLSLCLNSLLIQSKEKKIS